MCVITEYTHRLALAESRQRVGQASTAQKPPAASEVIVLACLLLVLSIPPPQCYMIVLKSFIVQMQAGRGADNNAY